MANDSAFLRYDVTVRQQPQHARISAMKISDRRPVDPPIIVQLRVTDLQDTGASSSAGSPAGKSTQKTPTRHSHLTNPYYFMYAALVATNGDTDVKYDGGKPSTSGALVSSVRVLKDHPNSDQDAAFFIFPDICVRLEGSWRFKLSLFVIDRDQIKLCAVTFSQPFFVYPGKLYPGVQVSTPLTRALAAQGVKLRIRKEIREKSGPVSPKEESQSPRPLPTSDSPRSGLIASPLDTSSPGLFTNRSPPKRRRTLMSPGALTPSDDSSASPTDISNSIGIPPTPVEAPLLSHPGRFDAHGLVKTPEAQYDNTRQLLRRASLSAGTQLFNSTRLPWPGHINVSAGANPATRAFEGESDQFNFQLSVPIPKPEPDYPQWGILRPSHPSPESSGRSHAYSGSAPLFNHASHSAPRLSSHLLHPSSGERFENDDNHEHAGTVYSWSSAATSREMLLSPLAQSPPESSEQHFTSPGYWHVDANASAAPRGTYEAHAGAPHLQRAGYGHRWAAGRPIYDGPTHSG